MGWLVEDDFEDEREGGDWLAAGVLALTGLLVIGAGYFAAQVVLLLTS